MSERGAFRGGPSRGRGGGGGGMGGGGGRGGGGYRSQRGGGAGGGAHQRRDYQHDRQQQGQGQGQGQDQQQEKPKKENILDLTKYMDKEVHVKFNGGREISGILKGYDQLMNLVLDDVKEVMRDDEGNKATRSLGLVVARGTLLVLISPADGSEEITNPFLQEEAEE
ncbi:hypothetical protein AJ80_00182 [Polytolypa hystricis UAMH7299]|uniref:Sm domain-containing protein n=1 Tax=Polytolypa hystricis (strain UAMH7299) TaxID=1447883 RepID=A0A2B7Z4J9_POLH7|nr:hypothetical protein AJ80_00182 [Polytolypa hystricis UAMH7299]